jgi:CRP/FNR family transcriptional regulator, cyclic AMP receptor protein
MPRRSFMPIDTNYLAQVTSPNIWVAPVQSERTLVPKEELVALTAYMPVRTFQKGERVFHGGQSIGGFHLVVSGRVKIVAPSSLEGERVVALTGIDELFGTYSCTSQRTHTADAIALEDGTRIVSVPCNNFLEVTRRAPSVAVAVTQALAERVRDLEAQVAWATLPAPVRLARIWLSLAERFGLELEPGLLEVHLDLKHHEVAGLAGTTRVSATRALGVWRSLGIVIGTRGLYQVKVPELRTLIEYLEAQYFD